MANRRRASHRKSSGSRARRRRAHGNECKANEDVRNENLPPETAADAPQDNCDNTEACPKPCATNASNTTPLREMPALSNVTNTPEVTSPAVLRVQVPSRTFSEKVPQTKRAKRSLPPLFTPMRLGEASGKRLHLDDDGPHQERLQDQSELRDPEEAEIDAVELTTEADGDADRLGMILRCHYVDLKHVLRQYDHIKAHGKHCTGGRMRLHKERNVGLHSTLIFRCDMCAAQDQLTTHPEPPSMVNLMLTWAALSIGLGFSQVQEFMAVLNLAVPSCRYYRSKETEVGNVWKEAFEKERIKAVEEEKDIARTNGFIEDDLPVAAGKMDGGWCKRTYGHGYNAKSGVAVIIGACTKKILFLGVENKYCRTCELAEKQKTPAKEHICNRSYTGPSTGMESSILVKGVTKVMREGLFLKYIIGDGDANVYSSIRQKTPRGRYCAKVECANHMTRGYTSKLHKIIAQKQVCVRGREFLAARLQRLTAGARAAIKNNKGKTAEELRADLMNGPRHVFGDHANCGAWCTRKDKEGEHNYIERAQDLGLLDKVNEALSQLYAMAPRLLSNETSNDCECYMSILSKFTGGKRVDFSMGPSYGIRSLGAALAYTFGPTFHIRVWQDKFGKPLGPMALAVLTRHQVHREVCAAARTRQQEARAAGEWLPRRRFAAKADQHYGATDEQKLAERPDMPEDKLHLAMAKEYMKLKAKYATPEICAQVERDTRGQSDNPNWAYHRAGKFPASQAGTNMNMRATTCRGKFIKSLLHGADLDGLDHIMKGRVAEGLAKTAYEERYNVTVGDCGTTIRPDIPHMCASLDGTVGDDGCIEVRNFSKVTTSILDTFRNSKTRKMLRGALMFEKPAGGVGRGRGRRKGTGAGASQRQVKEQADLQDLPIVPNPRSKVYGQVQQQLALSGRKWCDLILWSENDWEVFRILPDAPYWEKLKDKNDELYFNGILPEIVDSRLERDLPPREPDFVVQARRAAGKPIPFGSGNDSDEHCDAESDIDIDSD